MAEKQVAVGVEMMIEQPSGSLYECDTSLLGYDVCWRVPMSERGLCDEATTYFKTVQLRSQRWLGQVAGLVFRA